MKKRAVEVVLHVEYIPLPVEREASWRAGLSLLLQFMEIGRNESLGAGRDGNDLRIGNALFPLANIAQRKRTAKTGGLHAWVIGHGGSVHRMALADWRV